jgi:hypothetical protein
MRSSTPLIRVKAVVFIFCFCESVPVPNARRRRYRKSLSDLNDFEARAELQGAHAYFMYPSYIDRSYVINVSAIDSLAKRLSGGMRVPIVGMQSDFVYPKQYFFDTRYHLTGELLKLLRSLPGIRDSSTH